MLTDEPGLYYGRLKQLNVAGVVLHGGWHVRNVHRVEADAGRGETEAVGLVEVWTPSVGIGGVFLPSWRVRHVVEISDDLWYDKESVAVQPG